MSLCSAVEGEEDLSSRMMMTSNSTSHSIGYDQVEGVSSSSSSSSSSSTTVSSIDEMAMLTKLFNSRSRTVKSIKSSHNKFNTVLTSNTLGVSTILRDMEAYSVNLCSLDDPPDAIRPSLEDVDGRVTRSSEAVLNSTESLLSQKGSDVSSSVTVAVDASAVGGVQLTSVFSAIHGREPALTNWNGDFQG